MAFLSKSWLPLLLSVLGAACAGPLPLQVERVADMPAAWRPPAGLARDPSPWSAAETVAAERAVHRGLEEMIDYFAAHPKALEELGEDAVECFVDAAYAADHWPEFQARARAAARRNLLRLAGPFLRTPAPEVTGDDFESLLALSAYAHYLMPHDARTQRLVRLANGALGEFDSLAEVMGADYRETLARARVSVDDAYDLVMWSISLVDAQTIPGLLLPVGAAEVMPATWRFLSTYDIPRAPPRVEDDTDDVFYDAAYLVTHAGYIPTGYGRHPLYIEDAPWLYRYLRENFYAVLQIGELDLVAEFVDLLRQYGCTEDDVQVRDGSRHLLKIFAAAGDSFMAHRESYETGAVEPYDLVHKPWTGISGLRTRRPMPPFAGSYGAVFRRAFPVPATTPASLPAAPPRPSPDKRRP